MLLGAPSRSGGIGRPTLNRLLGEMTELAGRRRSAGPHSWPPVRARRSAARRAMYVGGDRGPICCGRRRGKALPIVGELSGQDSGASESSMCVCACVSLRM